MEQSIMATNYSKVNRFGGKDLTGMQFNRWHVVSLAGRTKHGALTWNCVCDCGNKVIVSGNTLRMGTSKSCGCIKVEFVKSRFTKHGKHDTSEHRIWRDMFGRCQCVTHASYADYGGRGITVCERWRDFANFLADMGERPSRRHSIDRINNSGNYEPSNCRWATPLEQSVNRRNNHIITYNGGSLTLSEWSKRLSIAETTLSKRLYSGWSDERALSTPVDIRFRNTIAK